MYVSKKRSILKAVSWRIVGTLDTMALGWIVTGNPVMGLKIGALELCTKFVLYYFHERIWVKSMWGTKKKKSQSRFCYFKKIVYICPMEKLVQIIGIGFVLLCLGCITWTVIEYIYLKIKNPKI